MESAESNDIDTVEDSLLEQESKGHYNKLNEARTGLEQVIFQLKLRQEIKP